MKRYVLGEIDKRPSDARQIGLREPDGTIGITVHKLSIMYTVPMQGLSFATHYLRIVFGNAWVIALLLAAFVGQFESIFGVKLKIPRWIRVGAIIAVVFFAQMRVYWELDENPPVVLRTASPPAPTLVSSPSPPRTTPPIRTAPGINVGRDNNGIANNGPNYGNQAVTVTTPSRVLDEKQADKFSAALQGSHSGAWIFTDGTDSDVIPLAIQLCDLFHAAHWKANCVGIPNGSVVSPMELPAKLVGLHCYGVGDEIRKAFHDSELACVNETGPLTFSSVIAGGPAIVIGNAEKK